MHLFTSVKLKVLSRIRQFDIDLACHVLPKIIEDFPLCPNTIDQWDVPNEFISKLTDPSFRTLEPVVLLIDGGVFFDLLEAERISLGIGYLRLQDSKQEYVITGKIGAVCLLNIKSVGQTLEEKYMTVESCKIDDYGCLLKDNRMSRGTGNFKAFMKQQDRMQKVDLCFISR